MTWAFCRCSSSTMVRKVEGRLPCYSFQWSAGQRRGEETGGAAPEHVPQLGQGRNVISVRVGGNHKSPLFTPQTLNVPRAGQGRYTFGRNRHPPQNRALPGGYATTLSPKPTFKIHRIMSLLTITPPYPHLQVALQTLWSFWHYTTCLFGLYRLDHGSPLIHSKKEHVPPPLQSYSAQNLHLQLHPAERFPPDNGNLAFSAHLYLSKPAPQRFLHRCLAVL